MEQIRQRARDGLVAIPRVGMGIGGLLLGVREHGRIRLLDSVEIPCSHSNGPSFNLTGDEKQQSREMIAEAESTGITGKLGVIGWYCSKTRGDATLNESDLAFYSGLFPEHGRIALVVRPSVVEPMQAVFFFRNENGEVIKGIECEVDGWLPPEASSGGTETRSQSTRAAAEVEISEPVVDPPVTPRLTPSDAGGIFGVPGLAPPQKERSRGKLLWVLSACTAIAVGAAVFVTQDSWLPKPPLALNSTESNGNLIIRWNPEALRGIDHASMYVNDGGQPIPALIVLNRSQLHAGLLNYTPKSQRVSIKLDAGDTTAITAWFAAAPAPNPEIRQEPQPSQPDPKPEHP